MRTNRKFAAAVLLIVETVDTKELVATLLEAAFAPVAVVEADGIH